MEVTHEALMPPQIAESESSLKGWSGFVGPLPWRCLN